ncbi:MAG: ribbon-helix-helix domain-containing protein [Kiloniellales bacterium]|nr:ribbon-helix-helix domain-containing protein [Kiloniellales bacterium]
MTGRARPRKRSITIAGHRTSLSLEQAFWDALAAYARQDGVSIDRLLTEIDEARESNLSSAARVYVLERLRGEAGRKVTPPLADS